jgi:ATP-dependent DNA helicase 2 subunit 1
MNFEFGGDQDDDQPQDNSGFNDADLDFFTEEEIKNGDFREVPDEVIFLIHITPSIFKKSSSERIPILEALKGFSSYLKSKIISNSKDKVGLVFYNSP